MTNPEIDQAFAENQFHLDAMKPAPIQIKVERESYIKGFYASLEGACMCPECQKFVRHGTTVQEAIDELLELFGYPEYTWG